MRLQPRGFTHRSITSWRSSSGWELLKTLPRVPQLVPHVMVVRAGPIDLLTTGTTATSTTPAAMEGDFYGLAASAEAWDSNNAEKIGFQFWTYSPYSWWGLCEIRQGGLSLMNQRTSFGAIFGRSGRPYYYPCPWVLPAGRQATVSLINGLQPAAAGNADIEMVWYGFRVLRNGPRLPVDFFLSPRLLDVLRQYRSRLELGNVRPFFYSLLGGQTAANLAQGDTTPQAAESPTVTVSGGDFIGLDLMAEVFDDGGGNYLRTDPGFGGGGVTNHALELLIDNKHALQDRPIPLAGVTGHGKRFFKLPRPLILKDGQTLTAVISPNTRVITSPLSQYKVALTVAGVKIQSGGVYR